MEAVDILPLGVALLIADSDVGPDLERTRGGPVSQATVRSTDTSEDTQVVSQEMDTARWRVSTAAAQGRVA